MLLSEYEGRAADNVIDVLGQICDWATEMCEYYEKKAPFSSASIVVIPCWIWDNPNFALPLWMRLEETDENGT